MAIINLKYNVIQPFGNLFRKRCVLVAVEDNSGKIIVGTKTMYPPTIYRLLGGGVDDGEDLRSAAAREIQEELDITIKETDLLELSTFVSDVTDEEGRTFHNETYVYYANIGDKSYEAGDDVSSVIALSLDELSKLGDQYYTLSEELWYKGVGESYCWADYAKLYGPVHKTIAEELIALKNTKKG